MAPYLEALQAASGQDFSVLGDAARASLIYQTGADHLMTRRALSGFLSTAGVARWEAVIDGHIEACLTRLAESTAPDLVRDFSNPLFIASMRDVFGLTITDETAFLSDIHRARVFTEPMLRLRELQAVQDAYSHLIAAATASAEPRPDSEAPTPLVFALTRSKLPEGVDGATLIASLTVADLDRGVEARLGRHAP
ncbi:MAG: hypothetical protein EON85_14040 [Brevundimonas sp.]|nr:MAG: hypothetical protein EON85_14040 [Brevundimonas sp.]